MNGTIRGRKKARKKLFNLSHSPILFRCCNFDCICHRLLYQVDQLGGPMFFFVFFPLSFSLLFLVRLILKLTQNSHLFCKWISSNIQEKYYYWVVYAYISRQCERWTMANGHLLLNVNDVFNILLSIRRKRRNSQHFIPNVC